MDPIGGRFAIERDAGAGGMARVYRARDLTTDRVVALKLLTRMEEADLKRFTREVAALSELRDPAIPQYIAHGFTALGEPWIAMEWLDGETLDGYLARGPLSLDHALALGRAVAGALTAAHAHGLIHRDVKPGNVFLAGAEPARAKLIDFGLARDTFETLAVTRGGDLLGTPLYMAPEQARGELDLDARVDVYALGALLFTCLTGKPPFLASTLVALLAKIVVEDAPSLAEHAPDIPPALDALVSRMLAKHRDERPANAGAVAVELDALRDGLPPSEQRARALSARNELRVVSVLLANGVERSVAPDVTLDATIDARGSGALALADGSSIVTFTGPETPGDLAARAIRYALGIQSPTAAIALATGRAVMTTGTPMGEVIERAGKQLALATGTIRIDDDTAGLVEGRFELARDSYGAKVLGETTDRDALRTLLGRPTRCVGRDRELAAVEGHYAEVVSESISRAVLVYAEAGIGKSRFAREVVRRLASRDDAPDVMVVRGEPNTATTALASIASAVRREIGAITDEFLAELVGVPVESPSDQLRAARESPILMFEQLRAAWTRWLAAAVKQRAQLIVVEDLQWVDAQSLLLVDAALETLADQPVLVFAAGRPEARRAAPFATRKPHELRLDPLPKRASERLVREALGEVTDGVVGAIVERAGGNALFLEELVRAFSESVTSLPVGVIGTVQLRLDGLRPEARAVLRAASVFGERFDADGVASLLGRPDLGSALDELVVHELIARSESGFAFRHALVREAAYALLTDEDRLLAHRLAAEQLERTGAHVPGEIAHHYQLARCGQQAADWFVRAGEHALLHNDLAGAVTHARRALAWADQTVVRGRAQHVIAESEMWRANLDDARVAAKHAVDNLPVGTLAWFEAVAFQITIAGQLGGNDEVESWIDRVVALDPDAESLSAYAICLARAASQLYLADRGDTALRAHARLEAEIRGSTLTPYAQARVEIARAYSELYRGAMDVCTDMLAGTIALYERVGARREAVQTRAQRGSILGFAGSLDQARAELHRVLDESARLDASYTAHWARWQLSLLAAESGDAAAARAIMESVGPRVVSQPLFLGGTAVVLGWLALADGDLATVDFWLERTRPVAIAERYVITLGIFEARARQMRGDSADVEAIARRGLDYIEHHAGMRCDVHLSGISVALDILANAPDAGALIAQHQARLRETSAVFGRTENAELFLALPWLANVLRRQPA